VATPILLITDHQQGDLQDNIMVVNNTILGVASSVAASNSDNSEVPRACLICRPNSHPFNDRTLSLESAVKVGRSVARARALPSNAIFDCKVLSRNHALLWYEAGKFYLQDTKSSNGTFVNNQRLSKGSEESAPREVCSGDILQFGVDVMENSRKVTHGCIIATLKLYLPDGKEAKASPTIVNSTNNSTMLSLSLPTQDLYQLNQYIQVECSFRSYFQF
jgi:pSer/pThr/pTyr-binding forkhead associated (FHA) protein